MNTRKNYGVELWSIFRVGRAVDEDASRGVGRWDVGDIHSLLVASAMPAAASSNSLRRRMSRTSP
jgi:hypothetical protein